MYGVNLGVFDSVQEYMQEKQPEPKTISPKSIVRIENMSRRDFTLKNASILICFSSVIIPVEWQTWMCVI